MIRACADCGATDRATLWTVDGALICGLCRTSRDRYNREHLTAEEIGGALDMDAFDRDHGHDDGSREMWNAR